MLPINLRISIGDPIGCAAHKIITSQFGLMRIYEPGARLGEDIEELHKMRVAVRRIRSAYKTLGRFLPFQTAESYSAFLSQMTDFLGIIRNQDVFIINANQYSDNLEETNQIKGLLLVIYQTRKKSQTLLNDFLDSLVYQDFLTGFEKLLSQPNYWESSDPLTKEVVPVVLSERFERIKSFDLMTRNYHIKDLHRLRIRIKDFRYTLEFFEDILDERANFFLEDLKGIQDHLGSLNDSVDAQKIIFQAGLVNRIDQETFDASQTYLEHLENNVSEKNKEFSHLWDQKLLSDWEEKLQGIISI